MRKTWIILAVLAVFALVSTVSAAYPPPNGPKDMTFSYNGDLVIKFLGKTAQYNNVFGIFTPGPKLALDHIKDLPFGKVYSTTNRRCSPGEPVVVYITTPTKPMDPDGPQTYYSNVNGGDGLQHADVSGPADGPYIVGFEDIYDSPPKADYDFDDVQLEVTCTRDITPIPEFPTMALPAALIVGMLGAVLFIQRSKEN
jgi:hypothetical protein